MIRTFLINWDSNWRKTSKLTILLNEKSITNATIANLPTNSKRFSVITGQKYESASNEVMCNKVNELSIVKWLVSVNEYQWYIGYMKQEVEMGLLLTIYTELVKKQAHSRLIASLKLLK